MWCRADDVVTRPTTHGVMVLLADGRVAGSLTSVERDLWAALADPSTTSDLIDEIAHRRGRLASEPGVIDALTRLAARGLVREEPLGVSSTGSTEGVTDPIGGIACRSS